MRIAEELHAVSSVVSSQSRCRLRALHLTFYTEGRACQVSKLLSHIISIVASSNRTKLIMWTVIQFVGPAAA